MVSCLGGKASGEQLLRKILGTINKWRFVHGMLLQGL
jgi:hypothetical protein